ncbi:unnamed protein product [Prunus brigantina]
MLQFEICHAMWSPHAPESSAAFKIMHILKVLIFHPLSLSLSLSLSHTHTHTHHTNRKYTSLSIVLYASNSCQN